MSTEHWPRRTLELATEATEITENLGVANGAHGITEDQGNCQRRRLRSRRTLSIGHRGHGGSPELSDARSQCTVSSVRAFSETIYADALGFELTSENIPFARECAVTVNYRGNLIGRQRIDFIVSETVILEIKAVTRMDPVFEAKLISYLKTTSLRAGLLINFNLPLLKDGVQRIVVDSAIPCDISS